jgi:transposase
MLNLTAAALRVFLAVEPCDMRKSFNGLYELACRHHQTRPPGRDSLFVFTNKRRTRIKILYFDGNGLWVAAKRLEKGTFSWIPNDAENLPRVEVRSEVLQLILDGVDLRGATLKPWYRRD